MAEECADDDDDKANITALRQAVLRELNLHSSVLQVLLIPKPILHFTPIIDFLAVDLDLPVPWIDPIWPDRSDAYLY
jgi:hypothetical protein